MPEFCGDATLYADPADAGTFGKLAHSLVTEPALRAEMKRRARLCSEKFTWSGNVRSLLETLVRAACAS